MPSISIPCNITKPLLPFCFQKKRITNTHSIIYHPMKNFLLLAALVCTTFTLSAQDQFRIDYDVITLYADGEWGPWEEGDNTFVFNPDGTTNIVHYFANGDIVTYRRTTDVEEGETDKGEHYQMIVVLDADGNEVLLQYFDNPALGLKLIYSEEDMLQFAQKQ